MPQMDLSSKSVIRVAFSWFDCVSTDWIPKIVLQFQSVTSAQFNTHFFCVALFCASWVSYTFLTASSISLQNGFDLWFNCCFFVITLKAPFEENNVANCCFQIHSLFYVCRCSNGKRKEKKKQQHTICFHKIAYTLCWKWIIWNNVLRNRNPQNVQA